MKLLSLLLLFLLLLTYVVAVVASGSLSQETPRELSQVLELICVHFQFISKAAEGASLNESSPFSILDSNFVIAKLEQDRKWPNEGRDRTEILLQLATFIYSTISPFVY